MIHRLKELQVKGFRSFRAIDPIKLDSDIVLIYGKNGTGKTSLMSAIEFGITGQVHDLARFTADYPRCLKNVRWNQNAEVRLEVTTPDGDGEIVRTLQGSSVTTSGKIQLTKATSRHFADRCYLSQSRLTRLLELYQAADGDNPEQLLVRFIRELLGLDLLENITAGLYEVGDMRRLESACPNLSGLKRESASLDLAISEANRQISGLSTTTNSLAADIKSRIVAMGDPYPDEKWDLPSIKKRNDALQANSVVERLRGRETKFFH